MNIYETLKAASAIIEIKALLEKPFKELGSNYKLILQKKDLNETEPSIYYSGRLSASEDGCITSWVRSKENFAKFKTLDLEYGTYENNNPVKIKAYYEYLGRGGEFILREATKSTVTISDDSESDTLEEMIYMGNNTKVSVKHFPLEDADYFQLEDLGIVED